MKSVHQQYIDAIKALEYDGKTTAAYSLMEFLNTSVISNNNIIRFPDGEFINVKQQREDISLILSLVEISPSYHIMLEKVFRS